MEFISRRVSCRTSRRASASISSRERCHGLLLGGAQHGGAVEQRPLQLVCSLQPERYRHYTITQAAPYGAPDTASWEAASAAPGDPGRQRGKRRLATSASWRPMVWKASSSPDWRTEKGASRRLNHLAPAAGSPGPRGRGSGPARR